NWEAALALFLLLAVLIYDSIHVISPSIPLANADAASYVIMVMLGSITVMLLRMHNRGDSDQIDRLADRLIVDHAGRNPFIEDWLRSKLAFLKDLEKEEFGTMSFDISDMMVAIRKAERGDEIQAIDYGPGWKPEFERLQSENIEAKRRGVIITRVFIIPEKIAKDPVRAKSLWE